jgi:hypothetical protein
MQAVMQLTFDDIKPKLTQTEKIIQYIRVHGSITSFESFSKLHITQLAARIFELEREGYIFSRENVITEDTHYVIYRLEDTNEI